jgi:hypothetical protein
MPCNQVKPWCGKLSQHLRRYPLAYHTAVTVVATSPTVTPHTTTHCSHRQRARPVSEGYTSATSRSWSKRSKVILTDGFSPVPR